MNKSLLEQAFELSRAGEAFVLATVVRAEKPTSAKPGAKAIITHDGTLTGWIGGSCAEPTVRREARKALRDGQSRLLRLCPPESMGLAPQEGVVEVTLTCVSGGTLEIYIEPQLAQPHMVVVGHLATTEALVRVGKALGYPVTVMGLEAGHDRFPDADHVFDHIDFKHMPITPHTYIVIASHGNYDEDAVVAALQTGASYVALIASHKRATSLLQYLRDADITEEQLARLKYPAGLDVGAVTPEEIALSIYAEIVGLRRRATMEELSVSSPSVEEPLEARDPVCGMMVEIASAVHISQHHGETFYFCNAGCKRSFEREPEKYLVKE